jgi:cyclic pyranopterin phosphate synthase
MAKILSHIDSSGEASMVDVTGKPISLRKAVARGEIRMAKETIRLVKRNRIAKGNVFATARLAGIMAAKRTAELIPLCHSLPLTHCEVDFVMPARGTSIIITASATTSAKTGVEMEALMAVSVAGLTLYDMCKAVDKKMRIEGIRLLAKTNQLEGKIK